MTKVDSIRRESELDRLVSTVKRRIESSLGIEVPEIITFSPQLYLDAKNGEEEIAERKQHFISEFEENTGKLFKLLYEKRSEYFYIKLSEILKSLTEKLQKDLHAKRDEYRERMEYVNANMLPDFEGWLQKNSEDCKNIILQNLSKQTLEAKLVEEKNLFITNLTNEINALESKDEIKQYMTTDNIQQKINANAAQMGQAINTYLKDITTSAFNKFSEKFTKVYKSLAVAAIKNDSHYNFSFSHRETYSSITAVENTVTDLFSSEEAAGSVGSALGGILGGALGWYLNVPHYVILAAIKGLSELGRDFFSMFVTTGHIKRKSIKQLTEIIETNYFPQILSSTDKKRDQFLASARETVNEITSKYRVSYQNLIDSVNRRNAEEKETLETFSEMAETSISYLAYYRKELEASNKIMILSDEKHSYLDKIPLIMHKDFIGNSENTKKIADLIGSSAKITKYIDVMMQDALNRNDNETIVKAIELGANPNLKNENGESAIFIVIKRKSLEMVKFLIKHGADINAVNANMETPLIAAVAAGDAKIVEFLLANNADFKAKDKRGWTAKKWAKECGNKECLAVIQEYSKGLHPAVYIAVIILILAGALAASYYFVRFFL